MKDVDLGEPTSFLDHVYLGCTQRECQISKDIVDNYKNMFESRSSACAMEKLPETRAPGKPDADTTSSLSYDMEGHAKKCVERYCELANKTIQQLYNVATPCLDGQHFKKEEVETVGELSKVCFQIVLKIWYLVRIGGPDILWSVNKLERAVTKWTRACDKRLARLISYFITQMTIDSVVMWEIQHSIVDWDLSKTLTWVGTMKIQNRLRVEFCVFSEVEHSFS